MEQTLGVAHLLFAECGYAGVTMEDVARAVGVTKPLLYAYFRNKEQLYLACMEPAGDALFKTVVDALRSSSTPADALDAGLRAFFAFLAADRDAWRVLFDETLPASGEVAERVAEHRERLIELVAKALRAQMPRPRSLRARLEAQGLSTAVLGAAETLGRWWLTTDAMAPQEAAEMLIAVLGPGLGAYARKRAGGVSPRRAREAAA